MKQIKARCLLLSAQIDVIDFRHSVTAPISNSAGFRLIDERMAIFELGGNYLLEEEQYRYFSVVQVFMLHMDDTDWYKMSIFSQLIVC